MIEKLVQEFKEHEIILEHGLKYEIDYTKRIKMPFLPVFLPRKARKTIRLQQPTLATLSAIGREYLLFDIQEQIDLNKPYTEVVIMADKTAKKMTRVIATMATGIKDPAFCDSEKQDKEIAALANLIFYNVKPVLLVKLTQAVRMLCNVENFTLSISHMSALRKALPTLIEKEGLQVQ